MSLIRLAYASRASFRPSGDASGVEPEVGRILVVSRRNNPREGIVGGLYYGDGHFFQVLEGERDALMRLYSRIAQDSRHDDVTTLIEEPITARTFESWSMKYVPISADVQSFLEERGMRWFEPLSFDRSQCEGMIRLIQQSSGREQAEQKGRSGSIREAEGLISPGMRYGLVGAAVIAAGAVASAGFILI